MLEIKHSITLEGVTFSLSAQFSDAAFQRLVPDSQGDYAAWPAGVIAKHLSAEIQPVLHSGAERLALAVEKCSCEMREGELKGLIG